MADQKFLMDTLYSRPIDTRPKWIKARDRVAVASDAAREWLARKIAPWLH